MPLPPGWLVRAWRGVARFAEGRRAGPVLAAAALVVYAAVSVALPLAEGRDFGRYLVVYAQLFGEHVVYPYSLASRPPLTPVVTGLLLEGGPIVAEAGAAVLYATSILCWWAVARRFGPATAVATAVALLAYPGYALLFHQLSSDALFAFVFAVVALLVARAAERPTVARAALLGGGVAALVLVRPVAQVLLLLVLVPLVVAGTWRGRLRCSAAFALAAVLPLLGWAVHNAVRADDFTLARGGGATLPLFRAFVVDRIVEPENGPASRELERAVSRELLRYEPYRSYEVDLDEFFSSGSARMHEDLTGLSDKVWGWDDDYGHLAQVGREAVLAHPWEYARGVAGDVRKLLVTSLYAGLPETDAEPAPARRPETSSQGGELPVPGEGEPIPAARQSGHVTTPDGRIREVWTSPTEHYLVFDDPRDAPRVTEMGRHMDGLLANFPDREPRAGAIEWLNRASRWYPRPVLWLVVGLVAVSLRRSRRLAVPLVLAGAALLVLLGTSLAVYAVPEYAVPVAPAFVLLATAGVLGRARAYPG